MTFIELLVPAGALTADQRQQISERLVPELVRADGAPPEIIERGRAITWLTIQELDSWSIGGRPVDGEEPPRYVVRVTLPGGHLNDGTREELIARITRVLADIDDDPRRLYREPAAWIHIVELPDGAVGGFGRVVRHADIIRLTVKGITPAAATGATRAADTVVDPVCGMTVTLGDDAIVLEHDGTIYGFCNPGCRNIFLDQMAGSGEPDATDRPAPRHRTPHPGTPSPRRG